MNHDPLLGVAETVRERAAQIKIAVFDVDGTLTDGGLRYGADGHESKLFHARDGFGLKCLEAAGIRVAIISGRISHATAVRAEELGIEHVYQGQDNKRECLTQLLDALHLTPMAAAFTGDDLPDLPALHMAGLACAVADAHAAIIAAAHWTTPHAGGHGAARDVADLILAAQGRYAAELERWQ